MKRITIWDLPTRIFHWALLALVSAAIISAQMGGNAMAWHGRFGVGVLGLLAFRLTWGMIGSTYARFMTFVRGPATIRAYLRGQWQGLGHNPLGGLSVLAMLAVLLIQGLTGLFADDDIAFQGPYALLVSNDASAWLTGLHKNNAWLVGLLIAAHLAAIAYHLRVKNDNLVKPMLLGYKDVPRNTSQPTTGGGGIVALIIAVSVGAGALWVANGGLARLYAAPLPPASSAPA
ncbi:MAG: cytochrome b/b6 domain-containing protein [Polaromonas sp.]